MKNNLIILGAGGHGKVVFETAKALGIYNKVEFLDDNSTEALGKCEDFKKYLEQYENAFVAFGNNYLRMKWINDLRKAGFKLASLIHPTAYISPSVTIGEGTIICAKAAVNTNVVIERGSIISIGALIDHDSSIGECCHINTGAIVKSMCKVDSLKKIDAGVVYSGISNVN